MSVAWDVAPSLDWQRLVVERLRETFLVGSAYPADELETRLRRKIGHLLGHADLRKRVSQDDLVFLLDRGFVRTTFDFPSEKWEGQWPMERRIEEKLYTGYGSDTDRHISYGYPSKSNRELPQVDGPRARAHAALDGYGTVILVFKNQALPNVTAALCDVPGITELVTEPEVAPSSFGSAHWTSARRFRGDKIHTVDEVLDTAIRDFDEREYAEIHVHQRLLLADVSAAYLLRPIDPILEECLKDRSELPFKLYDQTRTLVRPALDVPPESQSQPAQAD